LTKPPWADFLENGSMAAAFRGDPGLPNLRRTTIDWFTRSPA
jgi:hypothetical protein